MTHTPGPWKVLPKYVVERCIRLQEHLAITNGGPTFAYLPNGKEARHDIQEANARLIAASPDLLEALRELELIAHRLGGESPTYDLLNNATAKARAAIATAEGTRP